MSYEDCMCDDDACSTCNPESWQEYSNCRQCGTPCMSGYSHCAAHGGRDR